MADSKSIPHWSIAAVLVAAIASQPASAQILGDIGGTISRPLEDLDRRIEENIEDQITRDLEDLGVETELPRSVAVVLDSSSIGNTLDDTLSNVQELGAGLSGIMSVPRAPDLGRQIDIDRHDGWPVIRNEWIVLVPQERADAVESLDVTVVERTELAGSGETLFIVSLTATAATASAVEQELTSLGGEPFDRNHVYEGASDPQAAADGSFAPAETAADVPAAQAGVNRIGLIDTDVDETHPALENTRLYEADFVALGSLRPQTHGTAVASIIVGASQDRNPSQRELLAASTFFLSGDGTTGATTASLIQAIDWLHSNDVSVVNFSLTGPPNRALQAVIEARQRDGMVFVAAVGNEGPASGPLFPAAYEGVVGVTAVDKKGQIYRWANRGAFVDVAALGVNVAVARPGGLSGRDSGTSFAAPVVSAFLGGWTGAKRASGQPMEDLIRASVGGRTKQDKDDTIGFGILVPSSSR